MYNNIWYFHNCCSFTYIDCKKYVCNFFHSLCRHLHRNGKTVTRLLISVVSGRQVGVEGGRRVFYILYTLVLFQIFMWPYYERETWIKYQRKKRRCAILRKISSVQLLSPIWLFVTPWTAARQASLSITNSWSLFKLMSIEKVMPSKHLILCCLLLLKPSIFPSIRVCQMNQLFISDGQSIGVSASTSVLPMSTQDLSLFRMDWLDLLAVQGTLKSLL